MNINADIYIQLAPKIWKKKKERPWVYHYIENTGFSFGGHGISGGMKRARAFAKQLKTRMDTNPEIIEL